MTNGACSAQMILMNSSCGGGGNRNIRCCDLFDLEPVYPAARIPPPPDIALLVIAVLLPEPGRIKLGHGDGILPQLEQWLQRTARYDLVLFIEQTAHDLKHRALLGFHACRRGTS